MSPSNGRRRTRSLAACLPLLFPLGGCGDGASMPGVTSITSARSHQEAATPAPYAAAGPARVEAALAAADAQPQVGGKAAEAAPAMPRKIIYNGYVDLVVADLGAVEAKLMALLEGKGGYVSETNVTGYSGSQRSGSWKVRVPAEQFSGVMTSLARLGELRSNRIDSQDVSQEYYDVEARIAVKKQEEKRLLKILDEAAGRLKDILEVEKELSRVRTEAEQMEGRLRWLAHNSALSTITVTVSEIKNYQPPVAPTFAQRIARAFQASTDNLGEFLMNAAVACVAVLPWLVLIVPAVVIAWVIVRLRLRFRSARA